MPMPSPSALAGMGAVLGVTVGPTASTVPICAGLPLLTPSTVTVAYRGVPPVTLLRCVTVKSRVVALAK